MADTDTVETGVAPVNGLQLYYEIRGAGFDWSAGVRAIEAPTMLVFADADAVRPAHIVELFELIGGGQRDAGLDGSNRSVARLAVLPGLTHYDIASAPAVAEAVSPFLDAPMPAQRR